MSSPVETGRRTCGDSGGVTKAGALCRVRLNLDPVNGLCLMHDPNRKAARDAVLGAGGAAAAALQRQAKAAKPGSVPKAPQTIEDAERFASWLTRAVTIGILDAKVAHVAAVCLKEFRGASEKRILEQQVRALRAELAEAKRKSPR